MFVKQNQSVLDAALEAGLDWPHDCKFGTCGQCKCKLVKGKIKPTSDYSYTLTKEELKDDYFLACQSRLTMDSQIEVELGDLVRVPPKTCNAIIKSTEILTSDILKVVIETENEVIFEWSPFSVRSRMIEMENVPFMAEKKRDKIDYMWRDVQRRANFYGFNAKV